MKNCQIFIATVLCVFFAIGHSIGSNEDAVPTVTKYKVNDTCLACICQAISNCDKTPKCEGDVCGMFRMTEGYWIDGGRHTVNGDDPTTTKAYQDCANDETCAIQTATDYLNNYAVDCDNNNVIDCYDYAGMHKWGPFGGCQKNPIIKSGSYYTTLKQCLCSSMHY